MVLDAFCEKNGIRLDREKFEGLFTKTKLHGEDLIVLKPLTYMNNSGSAVGQFVRYFSIGPEDIVIVHDDLDLPVGKIRLRPKGSAGGQKGMASIIDQLHTSELNRIRIGIGKDPLIPTVDYVLGKIPEDQLNDFNDSVKKAAEALTFALDHDFSLTMNRYNK
jgi:PTH1 family peptidyl-tRNA hydrolase